MADSTAGDGLPFHVASLRAAKMLAAISKTRLRRSSTAESLTLSPCIRYALNLQIGRYNRGRCRIGRIGASEKETKTGACKKAAGKKQPKPQPLQSG
jgi:hypothetical protein